MDESKKGFSTYRVRENGSRKALLLAGSEGFERKLRNKLVSNACSYSNLVVHRKDRHEEIKVS